MLLVSRQGKVRLTKWFVTIPPKEKAKIVKDATQLVLARRVKMCNFLEYKGEYWIVIYFKSKKSKRFIRPKDCI